MKERNLCAYNYLAKLHLCPATDVHKKSISFGWVLCNCRWVTGLSCYVCACTLSSFMTTVSVFATELDSMSMNCTCSVSNWTYYLPFTFSVSLNIFTQLQTVLEETQLFLYLNNLIMLAWIMRGRSEHLLVNALFTRTTFLGSLSKVLHSQCMVFICSFQVSLSSLRNHCAIRKISFTQTVIYACSIAASNKFYIREYPLRMSNSIFTRTFVSPEILWLFLFLWCCRVCSIDLWVNWKLAVAIEENLKSFRR